MERQKVRTVQAFALATLLVWMVGCAGGPEKQKRDGIGSTMSAAPDRPRAGGWQPVIGGAHDSAGYLVAFHLQERYDETFPDCRKDASDTNPMPAVLCSGILLRTVKRGAGFDVWNPNPNNPQPNGVSFSWLRKDTGIKGLAWGNGSGFIILPHFYADDPVDAYTQLIVLCAFPVDGWTNFRESAEKDGCGASPGLAGTGPCQAQGILTSAQWMARFGSGGLNGNQCGFSLKPGTAGAYQAFAQISIIRGAIGVGAFNYQNEIMVGTWAQNDAHIPLEAFFYQPGFATALSESKLNQRDFHARTGRWVPVIRVTLPTVPNGPATFAFSPVDQDIP
jgi:hypothetical protein